MSKRTITPEQMNTLFCSPQFIRKTEASSKPTADVFLEATDAEIESWLQEGQAIQKKMSQRPPARKWWQFWK